jgi:hypothetical protein
MEDTYRKAFFKLKSLNDSLLTLAQNPSHMLRDPTLWNTFNSLMDELAKVSEDTYYLTLKAEPNSFGNRPMMSASNLSLKAYQAVAYLHSTQDGYLDEFPSPKNPAEFAGKGNGQVITQNATAHQAQKATQHQETTVNIEFNQTLQYMTEAITEARSKFKEGTDERKFLDKLKEGVVLAKNTADLIKMIASAAAQFGISATVLKQIFS